MDVGSVIDPTDQQVTQYLMPQVRKVVNAVPLQSADDYRKALRANATIYAIWRNLRKIDYMCKHGQTYLASMNNVAFPLFQTENAAWLQSTINRLEEYLRANVRLPHTLCEYLAWRFGRVYKSNASAKAALVLYEVLPLTTPTAIWDELIMASMTIISQSPTVQKANSDLYNTYYDHDYMVEIRDDTQFRYDTKEFMLRLNCTNPTVSNDYRNVVAIDASLDNPTAFMASTVSSRGQIGQTSSDLFPIGGVGRVYIPSQSQDATGAAVSLSKLTLYANTNPQLEAVLIDKAKQMEEVQYTESEITSHALQETTDGGLASGQWSVGTIIFDNPITPLNKDPLSTPEVALQGQKRLILSKSVDLYNVGAWIPVHVNADSVPTWIDTSQLSIDAGAPTPNTVATEHIYAFANLVDIDRKRSTSYKEAEKLVARDTANLIDSLDVGTAAQVK